MRFHMCAFSVPKRDATVSENQDSVAPKAPRPHGRHDFPWSKDVTAKQGRVFFGIADGATEGVHSGAWAALTLRCLGRSFAEIFRPNDFEELLHKTGRVWSRYKQIRSKNGSRPLTLLPKWLEEETLDRGAFTTACVAWFCENNRWTTASIGDSCVFQERGGELIYSSPIKESRQFHSSPFLFSSQPASNQNLLDNIHIEHRDWEKSDRFYFATDALACWILRQHEDGKFPLRKINGIDDCYPQEFSEFVSMERETGSMRNDDTTLIRVQFAPEIR